MHVGVDVVEHYPGCAALNRLARAPALSLGQLGLAAARAGYQVSATAMTSKERARHAMSTDKKVDEGKGRLKEAAASLTDNDDLKKEGKADRGKASIKDKVDHVADKAKHALDGDRG